RRRCVILYMELERDRKNASGPLHDASGKLRVEAVVHVVNLVLNRTEEFGTWLAISAGKDDYPDPLLLGARVDFANGRLQFEGAVLLAFVVGFVETRLVVKLGLRKSGFSSCYGVYVFGLGVGCACSHR